MSQAYPAIALRGLIVHAPDRKGAPLLGPVDLEVRSGEHVLIVGPSGGGKSTLLRAIAGLALPTQGSVHLNGVLASDAAGSHLAPEKRGVGMLFQGGALWPHMSVEKTLRFVLKNAGLEASKARIAELLEQVRLSGFEKRLPGTLSGGERQRLSLARAMATSPRILLLDEPLGPLDAELRSDLLQMLSELHRARHWTTLHVTHDPAEALDSADRLITLRKGLLSDSTPSSMDGEHLTA